ncbi:MAG: hypothetical protein AMK72_03700 [Planctomycetes bacterium SM23_25]|nr:MAG: hypothetical protein AMK72_03700 [Planctomycetes bacterium SM23_25]
MGRWLHSQDPNNGIQGELRICIVDRFDQDWGWEAVSANHPVIDYAAYWHLPQGWQSSRETDMAFELMMPEPSARAVSAVRSVAGRVMGGNEDARKEGGRTARAAKAV